MNTLKSADAVLLSTKLKMPQPRRNYIVRGLLFEQLRHCSEMGVVFVEGAAGTGKTTLLSSFIKETGLKNTVWLSLDETNNNIFSFWYYFTAAVSGFLGEEKDEIFSLMNSNFEAEQIKRSISFLINRLCVEQQIYVVLDDFHYITDTTLIDSLEFFLKSMPENLHLFLLSRENPPVYLGALAVSGRLLFLSGEQMQLSRDESLHFLRDTMKLSSDNEELGRISDFAEGWIGGLQLAAAGGLSGDMLKKGGGFVADYLTREIFERLTAEEQNFLICTGGLSYFDADICTHLFGKMDFSAMISTLSDKNLFITCIDEEKEIYRYHNILSGYLKQQFYELPKQKQNEICGKAVAGFEGRGDYEEAARLLLAAKDYKNAMQAILKMDSNGNEENYINQLPVDLVISDPDLTFRSIIYNAGSGNFIKFNELYDGIEKNWNESPFYDLVLYAKNMLVRNKNLVAFPKVMTISEIQNLHLTPATASMVLIGFANLLIMDRNYALGEQFADLAQKTCMENFSARFYALSFKAQLDEETGRLNESLSVYRQMEEIINRSKLLFLIRYDYYIGIAGVYLKRMELSNAKEALDTAFKMVNNKNMPQSMIQFSYDYNLAEYYLLSGNAEKGRKIVEPLLDGGSGDLFHLDRLLLQLSAEDMLKPEIADKIMEEYRIYRQNKKLVSLAYKLLCARLMYLNGNTQEAQALTEEVLKFSRTNKNSLRLVEADLLLLYMTRADDTAGKRKKSNLLREAIYYAWENRIFQPFYVERRILNPILKSFYTSMSSDLCDGERQFLQQVMTMCACGGMERSSDILSVRELEVLGELAKGLTNPEIATELCISISTVKTHVLSIYGKLGVSSRLMAVKEGKRLGIIH